MSIAIETAIELKLIDKLPKEKQEDLASRLKEKKFSNRELVLKKNEPVRHLHFLLEGRLQAVDFTVDGREAGLFFIERNDYFGELPIIDGQPQNEYVISITDSRIATLPAEDARNLFFNEPSAAESITSTLAHRIRQYSEQRAILRLPSVAQRLCGQLLQIAMPLDTHKKCIIKNIPTQKELAIMIDTSRETVTRTLQLLQSSGAIERTGKDLLILRREWLQDIMEGKIDITKGRSQRCPPPAHRNAASKMADSNSSCSTGLPACLGRFPCGPQHFQNSGELDL